MNDTDKRAIEEIPADAVIQALKCCASEEDNCHRCPFMGVGGISDICITAMSRAALDLIYRKQSEGEWISVEERLPDGSGKFLVVDEEGYMTTATWYPNHGWFMAVCNGTPVTHWMPLPEPPVTKGA